MSTMPESINLMPFVCKWYSHSEPQHFKTQEELRNHIDKHIKSCNKSFLGYICPWEGCNKRQSSIIELEGIKKMSMYLLPLLVPSIL